jgi:AcrR family transcriptional regulator
VKTRSHRLPAQSRREQILDAAMALFCEKGVRGTSVREIARSVGVTEGLLYHYFSSKGDLVAACWAERSWKQHIELMVPQAAERPLRDALRSLLTDMMRGIHQSGALVRMQMAEMLQDADLAGAVGAQSASGRQIIADFVAERQRRGEVRPDVDPMTLAWLLLGYVHTIFLLAGRVCGPEWDALVETHVERVVAIVADGAAEPAGPVRQT